MSRAPRRVLAGTTVAVALVLVASAAAWFVGLPEYRPSLAAGEARGSTEARITSSRCARMARARPRISSTC
jgi:hypothetical protein